jgi:small subunit ribosomal protein S18
MNAETSEGAIDTRIDPALAGMKRYTKFSKGMRCRFCREKIVVDYKDVATLMKLCSPQGKVLARRKTGNCAQHQREVSQAIKRARYLALLPYVTTGIV